MYPEHLQPQLAYTNQSMFDDKHSILCKASEVFQFMYPSYLLMPAPKMHKQERRGKQILLFKCTLSPIGPGGPTVPGSPRGPLLPSSPGGPMGPWTPCGPY